jgi:hypothetical protein
MVGDFFPHTHLVTLISGIFNLVEMGCFLYFFGHIYRHDNEIAINILQPAIIRKAFYDKK